MTRLLRWSANTYFGHVNWTALQQQVSYCALNIFSATAIVFANKAVFQDFGFKFVTTLTFIHTIFTWVGMNVLAAVGFFQAKPLPWISVAPLALGYVGYIVLNNLSLNLNTVGLYQILKVRAARS